MLFTFSQLEEEVKNIYHLDQPCHELISLLEPFILAYKENENLLYFLFREQNNIALKAILAKIPLPEGLEKLKSQGCHSIR